VTVTKPPYTDMYVLYQKTGKIYPADIPKQDQSLKIPAPQQVTTFKGDSASLLNESDQCKCASIEEFIITVLSPQLVFEEIQKHAKAKVSPRLTQAVVSHYEEREGKECLIFEDPPNAYVKIVQAALEILDKERDWRTAVDLVDYGTRTGAYEINGQAYSAEALAVYKYTREGLALDAIPPLSKHSDSTTISKVADLIQSLVQNTVTQRALEVALIEYQTNSTALTHIRHMIDKIKKEIAKAAFILQMQRSNEGNEEKTYLDYIKEYFGKKGINID
jgi:hypothetical protein